MTFESVIQPELLRAYSETHYRVDTDPPIVLRINEYSVALGALFEMNSADSSAFITAYNPCGQLLTDSSNVQLNMALASDLDRLALRYFSAEGKHPSGSWPGEPSYLVIGLSFEASCELGRKYKQNAIVWCGLDLVPQLVMLR